MPRTKASDSSSIDTDNASLFDFYTRNKTQVLHAGQFRGMTVGDALKQVSSDAQDYLNDFCAQLGQTDHADIEFIHALENEDLELKEPPGDLTPTLKRISVQRVRSTVSENDAQEGAYEPIAGATSVDDYLPMSAYGTQILPPRTSSVSSIGSRRHAPLPPIPKEAPKSSSENVSEVYDYVLNDVDKAVDFHIRMIKSEHAALVAQQVRMQKDLAKVNKSIAALEQMIKLHYRQPTNLTAKESS